MCNFCMFNECINLAVVYNKVTLHSTFKKIAVKKDVKIRRTHY